MTKKDFSQRKRRKNKNKKKIDIQTQWTEIKQKKNQLIRTIEQIDPKKIICHERKNDRLCGRRKMTMNQTIKHPHKKKQGNKKNKQKQNKK